MKNRYAQWFPLNNVWSAIAEILTTGGVTITYEIQTSYKSGQRKTNDSRAGGVKFKSKRYA